MGSKYEKYNDEIRDLYSKGIMPKEISTIYNRPYSTICKICYRITWKHI